MSLVDRTVRTEDESMEMPAPEFYYDWLATDNPKAPPVEIATTTSKLRDIDLNQRPTRRFQRSLSSTATSTPPPASASSSRRLSGQSSDAHPTPPGNRSATSDQTNSAEGSGGSGRQDRKYGQRTFNRVVSAPLASTRHDDIDEERSGSATLTMTSSTALRQPVPVHMSSVTPATAIRSFGLNSSTTKRRLGGLSKFGGPARRDARPEEAEIHEEMGDEGKESPHSLMPRGREISPLIEEVDVVAESSRDAIRRAERVKSVSPEPRRTAPEQLTSSRERLDRPSSRLAGTHHRQTTPPDDSNVHGSALAPQKRSPEFRPSHHLPPVAEYRTYTPPRADPLESYVSKYRSSAVQNTYAPSIDERDQQAEPPVSRYRPEASQRPYTPPQENRRTEPEMLLSKYQPDVHQRHIAEPLHASRTVPSPPAHDYERHAHRAASAQMVASRTEPAPYHHRMTSAPAMSAAPPVLPPTHIVAPTVAQDATLVTQTAKRTFVVNKTPYERISMLGRGATSKVFSVLCPQKRVIYALKRVALDRADAETYQSYTNEIQLLKRLHGHDRIIGLVDHEITFGAGNRPKLLLMVMECGEIDFANLLEEQRGKPLNMNFVGLYWQQMLEAVQAVHQENVVHTDLKPANFVLVKGRLKIIDFGIAKAIANDTVNIQRDSQVGTVNYMSPEAIQRMNGQSVYKLSYPSDVWSLGCILYQMIYGSPPFQHIPGGAMVKMSTIANPAHTILFPDVAVQKSFEPVENPCSVAVGPAAIDSMKRCLTWHKEKRLTIPQLLEHEFLHPHSRSGTLGAGPPDSTTITAAQMKQLVKFIMQTNGLGPLGPKDDTAEDLFNQLRSQNDTEASP